MKQLEKQLRNGESVELNHPEHSLEVEFSKSLCGNSHFKLWQNGKVVHMSKTFKPLEKKLERLGL